MDPNQQPTSTDPPTPIIAGPLAGSTVPVAPTQPFVPQPSVPMASQPKKRRGLLVVCFAIILVLVLALVGALIMKNRHGSAPKPQPEQAPTSQQTTQLTDVIKLSDSVSVLEQPTVKLPSSTDGWEADKTLATGTVGVVHANGCKLNYVPDAERATDALNDDTAATDAAFARKLDSLKTTGTITELAYGTVSMTLAGSTKKIEFKTANMTYSTDLASYRLAMTGRVINGYTVGFNFYCPRSVFSSDLNDKALSSVVINLKTKESLQ